MSTGKPTFARIAAIVGLSACTSEGFTPPRLRFGSSRLLANMFTRIRQADAAWPAGVRFFEKWTGILALEQG
ncbi:MAG: hypothetical protein M3Y78_14185 [Pseudomonadota bacterium]|nr:hypothetical protein [Pseudomonadota bacterium]